MPNTIAASSSFPRITSHPDTRSGIISEAFLPHFQRFFLKLRSVDTVIPFLFEASIASLQARAAPSEIAGVIPVQWNQVTPSKTESQFTIPGIISAMEELARS